VIQFTLYSRSYCHLCEDMLCALQRFRNTYAFTVDVIDVDADADLVAKYDELVPVLLGRKDNRDPVQLCHYFLDETRVKEFLQNPMSR
jgi:thiol-disulfide isomerase/thioredoxin